MAGYQRGQMAVDESSARAEAGAQSLESRPTLGRAWAQVVESRASLGRAWGQVGGLICVAIAFVAASAVFLRYVDQVAVNLMFWDQWDFMAGLFTGSPPWDLFLWQQGPHRMGLAGLEVAAVASLSGWDGRADTFVMAGELMLAAALAVCPRPDCGVRW